MKFKTLDDLINAVDSVVRIEIDVDETTFDCDMTGAIHHQDGSCSYFYLHAGQWCLLAEQPTQEPA